MEPRTFGSYTLLHRIAHGGMADLYLARGREVAGIERLLVIKLVASRYSADPSFTSMFEDELRIVAHLDHPNIGRVIDVGQEGGATFLAMEFIHGQDLRHILRRCQDSGAPVPVEVSVPVGVRVCAALQHAHDALDQGGRPLDIVHRDVSPSNVMITYDGQVKLVDFGIAKAANRATFTVPGTIKGKLHYLSPEQVLGRALDRRTDVFGLGVCLWEATVGQHCFDGPADAHVYEAIVKGRVSPPSALVPGYPPGLERILLRALALRPEDRHPSMQAFQHDLEGFAAESGMRLSDLALSRFMRQCFAAEVTSWERARHRGQSLAEHLQEMADREDSEHVVLVSGPAGGSGTPSSASPAPILTLAPPGQHETIAVEGDATATERRRTMFYGERPPGLGRDPASPQPIGESRPPSAKDSAEDKPHWARGDALPAAPEVSSSDQRRTVIVGTGMLAPDASGRPRATPGAAAAAVVGPGAMQVAATRLTPAGRPLEALNTVLEAEPGQPAEPPQPTTAAVRAGSTARPVQPQDMPAPAPVIGRDRDDLAARRQRQAAPPVEPALKPSLTGDWAAQALSERRPTSTHPYFTEPERPTSAPCRGRLWLLAVLVPLALVAIAGLGYLGWRLRGTSAGVSPQVEPAGGSRPASREAEAGGVLRTTGGTPPSTADARLQPKAPTTADAGLRPSKPETADAGRRRTGPVPDDARLRPRATSLSPRRRPGWPPRRPASPRKIHRDGDLVNPFP